MHKVLLQAIIVIFLTSTLFSNDILTNYRINGLNNIEKKLDLELTKKTYWSKYLQNKDTTFGFTEKYSSVLTCNKNESTLHLYKKSNDGFKLVKDYSAFTGEVKGDKTKEGDLKTPIGLYTLTKKIDNPDSFYGPLAFVTSYPNEYDKLRGRNGHGIWIHGLPTKESRDDFTKGCIAIGNSGLECLDKNIDMQNTLLIINKTSVSQNISKETLSLVLANLYEWRYAWLYSDINLYLSFYATDFKRFDGMNFTHFTSYKKRIFKKYGKKTIIFNNISVIPYPNKQDIYQITFDEIYRSHTFQFSGEKSLMVRIKNNKIKIFTER